MDPLTAMALGSTMLQAISSIAGGYGASSIAKLQQSIANGNAIFLKGQADIEAKEGQLPLVEGALETSRTLANINRTLGGETGKFSASNLDPTYGSPLLLERFSAGQGETDLKLIGAKSELGYAGALEKSASTLAERASQVGSASAFGMQATQDIIAGWLGAGTALTKGLSNPNLSPMWSNLTQATQSIATGSMNFSPAGGAGITVSGGAIY